MRNCHLRRYVASVDALSTNASKSTKGSPYGTIGCIVRDSLISLRRKSGWIRSLRLGFVRNGGIARLSINPRAKERRANAPVVGKAWYVWIAMISKTYVSSKSD